MLKITSLNNKTLPLLGTSQPERIRDLDGTHTLTLHVTETETNGVAFAYIENEAILTADGDKYIIKDIKPSVIADTVSYEIEAVHKFFNDTGTLWIYDVIKDRKVLTLHQALTHCLPSNYTFTIHDDFNNVSFENFGDDWSLALFEKIRVAYNFEYVKDGTHLEIHEQIGNKTNKQMRYKHNIITIEGGLNSTNLATYIEGKGKPVEDEEGNSIEGEYVVTANYTSPLAETYGIMHAKPVSDERFTDKTALLDNMKSRLNDTVDISYTIEYDEFIKATEDETDTDLGDSIYLVHEILKENFGTRTVAITDYPLSDTLKPIYIISSKKESIIDRQVKSTTDQKNLENQVDNLDDKQSTYEKEIEIQDEAVKHMNEMIAELELQQAEMDAWIVEMNQRQEDLLAELEEKVNMNKYTEEYNQIVADLKEKVSAYDFENLSGKFTIIENEFTDLEEEVSNKMSKVEFDDAVGVDKWILSSYDVKGTDFAQTYPTFGTIKEKTPIFTDEITDSVAIKIPTQLNRVNHIFTNVRLEASKTVSFDVNYRNGVSVYMNGAIIYQHYSRTEQTEKVHLSLREGWNTIEVLQGASVSASKLGLSPTVSSQVFKMTTVIGVGDKNESRLIHSETIMKQTQDGILLKADKTVVSQLGNDIKDNSAEIKLLNDEIVQSVKKSEFNQYTQELTDLGATVSIHSDKIDSKVEKTVYDKLNDIVVKQGTSITQTEKDIALKVGKDEFNKLNNQVTTHETKIGANETQISLRAKQSDLNLATNRLSNAESQIAIQSDKIDLRVTKEEFDGLEIGGRNLVTGSKQSPTTVSISQYGASGLSVVPIDGVNLRHGDTVAYSVYVSDIPSGETAQARLDWYRDDGTYSSITGDLRVSGEGLIWVAGKISDDPTFTSVRARIMPSNWTNTYQVKYHHDQLEKGNKATDWTPAIEDTQSQINDSVKSTDVEYYLSNSATALSGGSWQTTAPTWANGKYMWSRTKVILNSGNTSYTPSANGTCIAGATGATGTNGATGATGKGIVSITEEYNLSTSKTTADGSWTTKSPTWESGKYVWTRSKIVYKDPASTAYTTPLVDNSWEAVNELEIGGRNLLLGSDSKVSNATYNIAQYTLTSAPANGDEYTVRIKGKLGSDRDSFRIYNTNGSNSLSILSDVGGGYYASTFKWKKGTANDTYLQVYQFVSGNTSVSTIDWIQLEKGNKATDWSPAPEDMDSRVSKSESSITVLEDSIVSKVEKSEVYTKTNVDTLLNHKLSTVIYTNKMSSIDQSLDKITTRVENTETVANSAKSGVATVTSRVAKIETRADAIESSVTELSSAVGNLVNNPELTGSHIGWADGSVTSTNDTFEGVSTRVLRNTSTTNSVTYSAWFDVDPSKAYEVSMWVRKSASRGRYYVGLHAGTADSNTLPFQYVSNSTGEISSSATNFYFTLSGNNTGWLKIVGYIMPSGTKPADMKNIGTNITQSAIMDPRAKRVRLRWLNYENGGTTTYMYVAMPKVVEVSGDTMTYANSNILQLSSEITSKVAKTDFNGNTVASLISQTASAVKIIADKIVLSGDVTITGGKTTISSLDAGKLKANSVIAEDITFTGKLNGAYGMFSGSIRSEYHSDTSRDYAYSGLDQGVLSMSRGVAGTIVKAVDLDEEGLRFSSLGSGNVQYPYTPNFGFVHRNKDDYAKIYSDNIEIRLGDGVVAFTKDYGYGIEYVGIKAGNIQAESELSLMNADAIKNALRLNGNHYVSNQVTDNDSFAIYGNRASGAKPFKVRSHSDMTGYRDDLYVTNTGNTVVEGRLINKATYDTTTGGSANVGVTASGYIHRTTSGRKYKQNIELANVDHTKLLKIKPKSWFDKGEVSRNNGSIVGLKRYYGAIADEFSEVGLPEYAIYDENSGDIENFNDRAWLLLIPNINDAVKKLDTAYDEINYLKMENQWFKSKFKSIEKHLEGLDK